MDDCCAVCTDPLEWVIYGPCGHRDVCSTCVVRLRFIMGDRCCCICKTECPVVFVTKALGDYTSVVSDFSVFPADATEGRVRQYWYHEDTQAYFDDVDHYKMVKAMCRLSCTVCDRNAEEQSNERTKRRTRFRSIDQLRGHLFHQHKLVMCKLCLEGRKVFICEQKLYSRTQLNQHISTGDSEVDGSESERGGFMGHPMCEFCRTPFYGDHELYMHMSTGHFTCHICQRQHPGQYDYFRDYNDLEMHFRQEHFLCENEACLEKKFVVFQTEAEMKRHNTLEHGGHMSRSKRNAVLRIPTSFRYRSAEQEQRRGRGRGFRPDPSNDQLSIAIQASLETAVADSTFREATSASQSYAEHGGSRQSDLVIDSSEATIDATPEAPSRPSFSHNQRSSATSNQAEFDFPLLSDTELAAPPRYAQALSQSSRNAVQLGEESFPPLPGATKPKPSHASESSSRSTLAARLQRRRGSVGINQHRPAEYHGTYPSFPQLRATPNSVPSSSSARSQLEAKLTRENGYNVPLSVTCTRNLDTANGMRHSASAPNLAEGQLPNQNAPGMDSAVSVKMPLTTSNAPGMDSAVSVKMPLTTSNPPITHPEDVHTANKSLVDRIRAALEMDNDRYAAFKSISSEYRRGLINTVEYLSYVEHFGLSHLVLELASLCPDVKKQQELIDAYKANLSNKSMQKSCQSSNGRASKKKGKAVVHAEATSGDAVADDFLVTVRKLQLNQKPQEEVETLSKDGYRTCNDKVGVLAKVVKASSSTLDADSSENGSQSGKDIVKQHLADGGNSKQRKKTSKFQRVRLGDGPAALVDLSGRDAGPGPTEDEARERPSEGPQQVGGVWRGGGAKKLFETSRRNA